MAGNGQQSFSHRSSLKQSNKPFKSKHASKGALKALSKGKTEHSKSVKSRNSVASHKADRRNTAKIEQRKKQLDVLSNSRMFQGLYATPKIIAVIPLCADVDAHTAVHGMFASIDQPYIETNGSALLTVERFKQRVQFIPVDRHLLRILDALKVADMVIFILSANEEVDKFGELCMTAIRSQGVPTVINMVQHLETHPTKKQSDIRKSLEYYMNHQFSGEQRLFDVHDSGECLSALRYITTQRPKQVVWRERHPYLVADQLSFQSNTLDETHGTLCVTGYLRGNKLDVNRLVHIPNYGDFQMSIITSRAKIHKSGDMDDDDVKILQTADPNFQEGLVAENDIDPMEGEQTWPTAEELAEADERVRRLHNTDVLDMDEDNRPRPFFFQKPAVKRRVPKGTSAYQAAWILDDDDVNSEEEQDDCHMSDSAAMDEDMPTFEHHDSDTDGSDSNSEKSEEYEDVDVEDREIAHDDLDEDEEQEQLAIYLQKQQESRNDSEFPDEIDTPQHITARERFQRYRGLKSFRSSVWDPYENLPMDYSRIFQFQNFKRSRKRVMDSLEEGPGVAPGTLVTIHISNVPRAAYDGHDSSQLFTVFGLLPYEHKVSTVSFVVQRTSSYSDPVKSKEPVVLMSGFRRYVVQPIYSTFTRGGPNNVHKFERYLQPGVPSVATVYAPIQFGPAPVLVFKHDKNGDQCLWTPKAPNPLIATGSLMDLDPLRIIAKRIVLTGHPYKVHKRGAVLRFMFFNPEDVLYFKPIQLTTKLGRTGHIKESLGTHGYMKCIFDAGIKQHDTVCMNLYKRVFPKWTTLPFVESPHIVSISENGTGV
ncbi:hypothetical protein BDV3_003673 [Batrachochytrium dendrobatidis]|uniref:Bms1-type G domain-containing protein n=1 Tax=Batrachochytrium dendrobatidis (strain JEL423) TaxID=403673 RepID=A0A177WEB7_BATDL|nr:hypothetical protein BDEG_22049 [Batrachochytrium dendrobatidis JEL423]